MEHFKEEFNLKYTFKFPSDKKTDMEQYLTRKMQ